MKIYLLKLFSAILLALGIQLAVFAESISFSNLDSVITPLQVGERLPDQLLNHRFKIIDQEEGIKSLRLSNYKEKLIILDFWATWCVPCIASLEKLNILQPQFPGELIILPITTQSYSVVKPFITEKAWDLPFAIEEDHLQNYFPYRSIPHQIWVKDGVIIAITGSEYTEEKYITAVLEGNLPDMEEKIDSISFVANEPLLIDGNGGGKGSLLYQSIITKAIPLRIGGFSTLDDRLLLYNSSILNMFMSAYRDQIPNHGLFNRVLMDVPDSLAMIIDPARDPEYEQNRWKTGWRSKNLYCYNLVHTAQTVPARKRLFRVMQNDLNNYFSEAFGFSCSIEKRMVKCLVLKNRTQGEGEGVDEEGIFGRRLINTIARNNFRLPTPIIDGTSHPVDMVYPLKSDLKDLAGIKAELLTYGLDLVEEERLIDMLVFSEITKLD